MDRDQRPLRNLFRGNDYRGVNQKIWEHWVKIYGGGPEIPRKSVDIYEDDGRSQLATDSHARRRSVEANVRVRNPAHVPPRPGGLSPAAGPQARFDGSIRKKLRTLQISFSCR